MTPFLIVLAIPAALVSFRLFTSAAARRRAMRRVDDSIDSDGFAAVDEEDGWLVTWLARAGYRDPSAASVFLGATAGLIAFALAAVVTLKRLGVTDAMVHALSVIPGGFADGLAFVAKGSAVIIVVILAAIPTLVV